MERFIRHMDDYRARVATDAERRIQFVRDQVLGQGLGGAVVGISGGIDSAVVAALCVQALGRARVLGVWMPAYSLDVHRDDAQALAAAIGLELVTVDIGDAFDAMTAALEQTHPLSDKTKGNTKARLRMTVLYALANERGYLVAGTDNASELYVGYSTKGGDALADFMPIASLTKSEIRILAQHLGIPSTIVTKPPSADLWAGQTDEQEMGFDYEALDRYILTGETDASVKERIQHLHHTSAHKRSATPEI